MANVVGIGPSLPATGAIGDRFFVESGGAGASGWYDCIVTNTWKAQGLNLLVVKGFNLNSVVDTLVSLPAAFLNIAKYIITRIIAINPSATLAGSGATIALFTAAAGGGTTLVAAETLVALTAPTKFKVLTLAAGLTADARTEMLLYLRNTVAHGSVMTCDVYIYFDWLP